MSRLVAFMLLGSLLDCSEEAPPAPTVALAEPVRGGFVIVRDDDEHPVRRPARVERGSVVRTAEDGRGSLRLDAGGWVLMDRSTSVEAHLDELVLQSGRLWVDARQTEAVIRTESGTLRGNNATFAVALEEGKTEVYCGAGEVTFQSGDADGVMAQGEELTLGGESPRPRAAQLWDDWTGGLADPASIREAAGGYIGVLAGRALHELGKARRPLSIRAHEVNVFIEADFATTEVTQTFFNAESLDLETEYRMRVPEDAIVSGFSIDYGGGFVDGVVTPMASDGYSLSFEDASVPTSRLSYDGPGRLRARIHPIRSGATARIRVRYSEWLERSGDRRTYAYPMVVEGTAPPMIGELRIVVDTSRALARAYRAGMGAEVDAGEVVLRRSDFKPSADFYLDLLDSEESKPPEGAVAYVVSGPTEGLEEEPSQFVLFDVPMQSEQEPAHDLPLELAVVVDVSGATEAEDVVLARSTVEALLRQLAPGDKVALVAGDLHARPLVGAPEGLVEINDESRESILGALAEARVGGATDLAVMLREAAELVAGRPRGAVLYLGDATPTTGAVDATSIRRVLSSVEEAPRFFGLAVGEGSNLDLLRALFGEESRQVVERTEASRAVMKMLADAAQPMLRHVEVDLGPSVERVFPRGPLTTPLERRLRLVGRLADELPPQVIVRGTLDGEEYERAWELRRGSAPTAEQDVQRRWATARLRELLDEDAGREALVELGVRFGIVTPWSSMVVVGAKIDGGYRPTTGFDRDPRAFDWGLGGGTPSVLREDRSGWRRRMPSEELPTQELAPERTWTPRVQPGDEEYRGTGDGGLATAAVSRALQRGSRGPQGCFERRLLTRPDLRGAVRVEVQVDGSGEVKDAKTLSSTLGEADVAACVLTEVRGIRYPATGGGTVTVAHSYHFDVPGRSIGVGRQCSDASRQSLEVRRSLWRERLVANAGVRGAISVWREAGRQCELDGWRARRTLLRQMLGHVGSVPSMVALYQAMSASAEIATYLRREILRRVRTPQDVIAVRAGLGLDAAVDWRVFGRLWKQSADAAARLRLVRAWLEVLPEEMDLRLRLLALLEDTGQLPEARRVAQELRVDPLADARVRTAVGELWIRQDRPDEARRVFSEIVEHAPGDPWARRRLGDLYRAHGWFDDAYREYQALVRLRPDDPGVLLLLARAAAGAGRTDEALRLEQRLGESVEPGAIEGVAGVARLWTVVRLAALKAEASPEQLQRLKRRERRTGSLRNAPAVMAILTWTHPDDKPVLRTRSSLEDDPDKPWKDPDLEAHDYGLSAEIIDEPQTDPLHFQVSRSDTEDLRDWQVRLTVIVGLGTDAEAIHRHELTLSRERREATFVLDGLHLAAQ